MGFGKNCAIGLPLAVLFCNAFTPETAISAVTLTSAIYTENFDGLSAGVTFPTTYGVVTPITGNTGWDGTRLAGSATVATQFRDNQKGASGNSGLYAFHENVSGERALGAIGAVQNVMAFGVALTNGTGQTLTNPTIVFDREQWRTSTVARKTMAFAYGTDATVSNYLTANLTAHSALDLVGINPTSSSGGQSGNSDAMRLGVQDSLTLTLLPGETLFLRWSDSSNAGSNGALAIDNLSITFSALEPDDQTSTPEPGFVSFALVGLLALSRRRRMNRVG